MKRQITLIVLLSILIAVSFLLVFPCNGEVDEPVFLKLTMIVEISEINFDRHTVRANITSLRIDGFPENQTNYVYVLFDNIETYEVNCTRAGGLDLTGTYDYVGTVETKDWYFVSYGEVYPFDFGYVDFHLYPYIAEYEINGTRYGLDSFYFQVVENQVHFSGLNKVDLENKWTISPINAGESLIVGLIRNESSPQYLIMAPLLWFLVAAVVFPSFCGNRTIKASFYSALIVFSPMFMFAIQTFIPPRNSLSIPEILSLNLTFIAVTMLLFSLPTFKDELKKLQFEIIGLLVSASYTIAITIGLLQEFLGFFPVSLVIAIIVVIFVIAILGRLYVYRRSKKINSKRVESVFHDELYF